MGGGEFVSLGLRGETRLMFIPLFDGSLSRGRKGAENSFSSESAQVLLKEYFRLSIYTPKSFGRLQKAFMEEPCDPSRRTWLQPT